jgi:hypothetical protein
MQTSNHAAGRAGQAVLNERGWVDPGRTQDIRVERAAEEATFIHVRGGRE